MFSIKPLPEFTEWLDGLSDVAVRGVLVARIKRLERGLMGDVEPVGGACWSFVFMWAQVGACISYSAARR